MRKKKYEVICEIGSGVNLPSNSKYKVRVQIGAEQDYQVTTKDPVETFHLFNRWSQRFDVQVMETTY